MHHDSEVDLTVFYIIYYNPALAEVTAIVVAHIITNGIECFITQLWPLSGIQLTRSLASMPNSSSIEIVLQQV